MSDASSGGALPCLAGGGTFTLGSDQPDVLLAAIDEARGLGAAAPAVAV